MPFEPFSLAEVYSNAEQIKGMRQRSRYSELQEMALGEDIEASRSNRELAQKQFTQEQQRANTEWLVNATDRVLADPDPMTTVQALLPEAQRRGIVPAGMKIGGQQLDIETIRALNQQAKMALGAPVERASPQSPEGKISADAQSGFLTPEQAQTAIAPKATAPVSAFRPMTAEEMQQIGLPEGSSAQVDQTTGKIDLVSRRDNTSTLSQKDRTTAQMKLNTVALARQQLSDIQAKFDAIKGTLSAGPLGQGRAPTESGRAFDRAVDTMRSTLTALTRVPGVGAMSDYETRLDQAKFPTRTEYEAVTQQQIEAINKMLNLVELGYTDLIGDPDQKPASGGATGEWTVEEVQ